MPKTLVSILLAILVGSIAATPSARAQSFVPGTSLRDCPKLCPEMIGISPGSFAMGSPATERDRRDREGPQHQVAIKYPFLAGKYDVTRDEYAAFVAETKQPDGASCYGYDGLGFKDAPGRNWRNPGFAQTGRDPVVCVSWEDAQAYVAWLSKKTGKRYRLLSESEWEYVGRAGTTGARYGSDDPAKLCGYINGADLDFSKTFPQDDGANKACSDGYGHTSPVGRFGPNGFGLYDMLGNVWEWTADCWNESYAGAPMNGAAWQTGTCGRHIRRGGSWYNLPKSLRAAMRDGVPSGNRDVTGGFRVARAL
jgi:formylglycine-generating enzyme required for sulfatase activity